MRIIALMVISLFGFSGLVACEKTEEERVNVEVQEQEDEPDVSFKFSNEDGSVEFEGND